MGVWFYLVTISIWAWISLKECSRVIDRNDAKGLYVEDYCPFMKGCKPGLHVMCLKNPNNIESYGPKCHGSKKIDITDQVALRLLNIINAIRRKAALGLEKGKGGKPLPRGYGIWRLEWDSELATFAQIWANQCQFSKDYCHATARFQTPSQILGLIRFTYPDWKPIFKSWNSPPGFSPKNIGYAIIKSVKEWYKGKNRIETKDILQVSETTKNSQYMTIVSGDLTHMGCGVSAYTEYQYSAQKVELLHNIIQLVCNFSNRLMANTAAYNITPPTTPDFSSKCGCPSGSNEDEDCLCYRNTPADDYCTGNNCKPTVVLLPIFTVEDAPYHKLPRTYGRKNGDVLRTQNSMEIFDEYERDDITDIENQLVNHEKQYKHSPWLENYPEDIGISKDKTLFYSQSPSIMNNPYAAEKSYIPNQNAFPEVSAQPRKKLSTDYPRTSIFSHPDISVNRKPPMEVNTLMKVESVNIGLPRKTLQSTMKDVLPRRNFNQVNDLLKIYMERKRKLGFNPYKYNSNTKNYIQLFKTRRGKFNEYPVSSINDNNNVKQIMVFDGQKYSNTTLMDLHKDLKKRKFSFDNFNDITNSDHQVHYTISNTNDYADNRLMKLLDKLEQEVKHIELRGRDKELFDAKIKKIYGNILKKHSSQNPSDNFKSSLFYDTGNDSYLRNHKRRNNNLNQYDISLKMDKSSEDETSEVRLLGATAYDKFNDDNDDDEGYLQQDTTRKRFANPYKNHMHKGNVNLRTNNNRPTLHNEDAKYTSRKETGDPLDVHRRKYYQDKLESLKRRFHNLRNRHMGNNRGVRPIRPTDDILIQPRQAKHEIDDAMYLPSRGRVVQGY